MLSLRENLLFLAIYIHDACNSVESIEKMIKLLESVISCLPLNQKKLYNAQKCYPGFIAWNKYWKEFIGKC